MEEILKFSSIEQARNAAIKWLEENGTQFGPHRKIEVGRLGMMRGKETGTSANQEPYWRIRLDYDPQKGAHFNAEAGKGNNRKKTAFCFPGGVNLVQTLSRKRTLR